ncbi:hypothetical protein ACLB1M_21400 [Escherichia coli]
MPKPNTRWSAWGLRRLKRKWSVAPGIKFEPIRPYEFTGRGDRIGWVKGIDDNWHLTLFIEMVASLIIRGVR